MNKTDLVEALTAHFGGDRAEAARALDAVLETVTYEIAAGGKVSIAGFGTFETITRPDRVVRDPRTGRSRRVKARPVPQFRAAAELKDYASGAKKPLQPRGRVVARRTATAQATRLLRDSSSNALVRHLIDFNPREPASYLFAASPNSSQAADFAAAAIQPEPIPWPAGSEPTAFRQVPKPTTTAPLPRADVLIVTYTMAEGQALAQVLTPGWDLSRWYRYRNGWQRLKKLVADGSPSQTSDHAAVWATTRIGQTTAVLMKCDLHPTTESDQLPIRAFWRQTIDQVQPRLVITTGVAVSLKPDVSLGDVVVSRQLRWTPSSSLPPQPATADSYTSSATLHGNRLAAAAGLLIPIQQHGHLPADDRPAPRIWTDTPAHPAPVATARCLTDDLTELSTGHDVDADPAAVDMNDAALALACSDLPDAPAWFSVRSIIGHGAQGPTAQQRREVVTSYEKFGYRAAIGSAIACWGLIARTNPRAHAEEPSPPATIAAAAQDPSSGASQDPQ